MPSYLQTYMPMVDSKLAYPLFQIGQLNAQRQVVRSPIMPNLHGYEEYKRIKGQEPAGEDWEAYRVLIGMSALSGVVLTHPDIPLERLSALRESFNKMTSDPGWGPETARVLGQPDSCRGRRCLRGVNAGHDQSPAIGRGCPVKGREVIVVSYLRSGAMRLEPETNLARPHTLRAPSRAPVEGRHA